jgi:translation elongation factor EF-G
MMFKIQLISFFKLLQKDGVLANENMMDICFNICDAMLSNSKHRGVDEIIPPTKSVMYGSQHVAKP